MNQEQKTVFITAFTNFVVRNLLDTDFLNMVTRPDNVRVVILAPEKEREYLEKNFSSAKVIIEGVPVAPLSRRKILIGALSRLLINTNTSRMFLKMRTNFRNVLSAFSYYGSRVVTGVCAGWKPAILFVRWLDRNTLPSDRFRIYFERYKPALVFSTDITDRSSGDSDIDLIREAKKNGIPVIGMVRSWDNLTTRGVIREVPDRIAVWNEVIKEECRVYNHIPARDVVVVGIPHYDKYLNTRTDSRAEFFRSAGLDPGKKTILFVAVADMFLHKQFSGRHEEYNRRILELLRRLDPRIFQVLVRFPLIGEVDLGNFVPPANMAFDRPAKLFGKGELNSEADRHLINSLAHSDVVLPGPSTIAVDALLFKKPVILIGFGGIRKFLDLEHLQPLTRGGGCHVASNEDDLIESIGAYANDPTRNNEQREKTLEQICYKTDGNSSQRLASELLRFLQDIN